MAPADGSEEAAYHLALRLQRGGKQAREEADELLQVRNSSEMLTSTLISVYGYDIVSVVSACS